MGRVLMFVIAFFFFFANVSGRRIPGRNYLWNEVKDKESDDIDVPFRNGQGPEKISLKILETNELKSREDENEKEIEEKQHDEEKTIKEDEEGEQEEEENDGLVGKENSEKYLESDVDEETISKAEKIADEDLLNGLNRILKNNETLEDVFRAENVYGFPS